MKDRVLIDLLIEKTLVSIRELTLAMYRQARVEATTADSIVAAIKGDARPSRPPDEATQVAIEHIWHAPLSTASVSLLRTVAARARSGVFRVSTESVDDACASLDRADLRRKMGIHEDDIQFVLPRLGNALVEVVAEEGEIPVTINRQAIRLVGAASVPPRPR